MFKDNKIKILFFGDIVGRAARSTVIKSLENTDADFVIANVENASHGFGLTEKNYNELSNGGIGAMTSGNHVWDKKEIFNYINDADKLVRPLNYPEGTAGCGSRIFDCNGVKIGVINLLGQVFMGPINSPWDCLKFEVEKIKDEVKIIFVDFHGEATAEKICFGKFASTLGVKAFVGTHTHVQTADEKIENNMAYITDVGFCGAKESVIGMEFETSYRRMTTHMPERYEVAAGNAVQINAVEITFDCETGNACDIKRISYVEENKEKEACCENTDCDGR